MPRSSNGHLRKSAGPTREGAGGRPGASASLCRALPRRPAPPGSTSGWLLEQERYQQLFLGALEQLVSLEKAHGNHEEALTYARRLTHRPAARGIAPGGDEALLPAGPGERGNGPCRRCASVLAEELGTALPRHHRLYDKIARYRQIGLRPLETEPPPPLFQPGGKAPFVGRAEERATLVDALESALASRGGVVVVEGEAGIGKTRLVREITEDARWRGFDPLGRLQPTGRPPPLRVSHFGACRRAHRSPHRTALPAGRPDLAARGGSAHPIPRDVVLEAPLPARCGARRLRAQAGGAGATGAGVGRLAPHLIVIDDLRWAARTPAGPDPFGRPGLGEPGTAVCDLPARRGAPTGRRLGRHPRARPAGRGRVLLGPLSVFDTAELVGRGFGAPRVPNRFVTRLHRETSGTPLFVLETLRVLHEEGHSLADLETSQLPLPASIYHLVAGGGHRRARGPVGAEAVAVHSTDVDLPALLATAEARARPSWRRWTRRSAGLLVGGWR